MHLFLPSPVAAMLGGLIDEYKLKSKEGFAF